MKEGSIIPAGVNDIRQYLILHGWRMQPHANDRIAYFTTEPGPQGDYASLILPVSDRFPDATARLVDATRTLAEFEQRTLDEMLQRIRSWDKDVLRARIVARGEYLHTLPLEVAVDAISGFRDLVGYAAFTELDPKPFFERAGPISSDFAKTCQFGHTFEGSFGFNIECPLSLIPILPMDGVDPEIPFERQVLERIATGLGDLRTAIAVDDIEPIVGNYQFGFSANMCRALDEIYVKVEGRKIEYDFIWSSEVASEVATAWQPFTFEGKAYEILSEAARRLEKIDQQPITAIQGRIVQLRSEVPPGQDEQGEFEHIITMFWEREKTRALKIRVPLTPPQYQLACDAHKDGKRIKILGIPEKRGKYWTLTKSHGFEVL